MSNLLQSLADDALDTLLDKGIKLLHDGRLELKTNGGIESHFLLLLIVANGKPEWKKDTDFDTESFKKLDGERRYTDALEMTVLIL